MRSKWVSMKKKVEGETREIVEKHMIIGMQQRVYAVNSKSSARRILTGKHEKQSKGTMRSNKEGKE